MATTVILMRILKFTTCWAICLSSLVLLLLIKKVVKKIFIKI